MTDIFKSADWAREAEEKKREPVGQSGLVEMLVELRADLTGHHQRSWTPEQRDYVLGTIPAGCSLESLGADHVGAFIVIRKPDGSAEKLYAVERT